MCTFTCESIASLVRQLGIIMYRVMCHRLCVYVFACDDSFVIFFLVNLTESFPNEVPILSLHSIYHKYDGRPFQYILKDMPYNSHWDVEEKALRMK